MARPNRLEDPEFCDLVATYLAAGMSNSEVSRQPDVGASEGSVRNWRQDPRIKSRLSKLINARVQEVTRVVDFAIRERLRDVDNLTTRELLDIRKEFLNGALREETEKLDDVTVAAAMDAANDAEFMAALDKLQK